MARKNGQTGGEDAPPVEAKQVEANPHESRLAELRKGRQALEAELAAIDGDIRTAISNGDVEALNRLNARKLELPGLFMAASVAETNARHDLFNAEDHANLKILVAAEEEREKAQATIIKCKRKFEEDMAALKEDLQQAEIKVSAATSAIEASRNLSAANDAGYRQSLANLAGV